MIDDDVRCCCSSCKGRLNTVFQIFRAHIGSCQKHAVTRCSVVHGSMLLTFHDAANDATLAQTTQVRNMAVLDTVTIVGRRI